MKIILRTQGGHETRIRIGTLFIDNYIKKAEN